MFIIENLRSTPFTKGSTGEKKRMRWIVSFFQFFMVTFIIPKWQVRLPVASQYVFVFWWNFQHFTKYGISALYVLPKHLKKYKKLPTHCLTNIVILHISAFSKSTFSNFWKRPDINFVFFKFPFQILVGPKQSSISIVFYKIGKQDCGVSINLE